MRRMPSPQDSCWDEEVIKTLKQVGSLNVEYPSELFAVRRAAFILQAQQQDKNRVENGLSSMEQFIRHFESLRFVRDDYPPELLTARRAAFVDRVEQYRTAEITKDLPQDREIIQLLRSLKSGEAEYPPNLMIARRAAFRRQLALGGRISVLEALRIAIRSLLLYKVRTLSLPSINVMRTSLAVVVLMLAIFVGSLLRSPLRLSSSQTEVSQPGHIPAATDTGDVAEVICKPGYLPPLCLAKEFDKSQDLTFQGNGAARPAVAKDTLPGYSGVHKPAYVNDGLYGPGASWISNSAYSWIKIDLGKATTINMVAFGRDRLGSFNDRDPGQFIIAVALSDNVYADGNSSNDHIEYTQVYNSEQTGFDGNVSGPETIRTQFRPVTARFIKITFANAGTAVDEVEVFMVQPPGQPNYPTKEPKEDLLGFTSTSIPVSTPLPTKTATPAPTDTPLPTKTVTPIPTDTPLPTKTAIPAPTDTPLPTDTAIPAPTSTPVPMDTAVPMPTDTSLPPPTSPPQPTQTSIPSIDAMEIGPMMIPTETPIAMDGF